MRHQAVYSHRPGRKALPPVWSQHLRSPGHEQVREAFPETGAQREPSM